MRFMTSRPYTASCRLCKFSSISMALVLPPASELPPTLLLLLVLVFFWVTCWDADDSSPTLRFILSKQCLHHCLVLKGAVCTLIILFGSSSSEVHQVKIATLIETLKKMKKMMHAK